MTESRANRTRAANGEWEYLDQAEAEIIHIWPEYSIEAVDDFIDSEILNEQTIMTLRGIRHDALQAFRANDWKLAEAHLKALFMACTAAGIRERMKPDAERGRKTKRSAAGHEATHGTEQEKVDKWEAMRKECERIHREQPTWGKTAVRETAAENLRCSVKTIQRRVDIDAVFKNSK